MKLETFVIIAIFQNFVVSQDFFIAENPSQSGNPQRSAQKFIALFVPTSHFTVSYGIKY
jgi:hypothetical protein